MDDRVQAHRDLVQFLEDSTDLDAALRRVERSGGAVREAQIFEPALFIGDKSKLRIGFDVRIDSFTKFEIGNGMFIGRGVHIASFAHVGIGGGLTEIGDYAAVASGAKIISGSNQLDAPSCSPLAPEHLFRIKRNHTQLGDFTCVFTNAIVCPGVKMATGSVLLPGGVLRENTGEWEIWGGVPARCIGKREIK